ncbi:MAG: S66 peptidase family protein [Nanoarchaeota archaeon]
MNIFQGKTVGLVSPSSPPKDINKAAKRISELGFKVVFHKLPKYLSWEGTPKQRAEQINDFFSNPEIDIIWCTRGGMGSSTIIPFLDFTLIKKNPKPFIGYSDITIIQLALQKHAELMPLQFLMPNSNSFSERDIINLEKVLKKEEIVWKIPRNSVIENGAAEGEIAGGCLDLLCSSMGTPHEIETDDKIFFLEDVKISPERLYNYLHHMKFSGKFKKIKGLVFAKVPYCKNSKEHIEEFLKQFSGFPILYNLDFGHTKKKMPIMLGAKCRIDTNKKEIILFNR